MKLSTKNYFIKCEIFAGLLILDQVTKFFLTGCNINIINNIVKFEYAENFGAGFGFLSGKTALLIVITFLFLLGIFVFDYFNRAKKGCYLVGMSFIFAGAVGNLIDRLFLGYVRDFVKLEFINFPIFNFADICLTIGVILIIVDVLFIKDQANKSEK